LKHPPYKRIAAVRIEFADGGIYEVSPDTRQASPPINVAVRGKLAGQPKPRTSKLRLGRCSSPSRSRCLRLDRSAHAFSVQFATVEKFEYLVCGQSKILAHCEDYLPICGLHRETHSHSMLPQ
jgi:hypothetical protein